MGSRRPGDTCPGMDRDVLQKRLAQAEERIAHGKLHIAGQNAWLEKLGSDGRASCDARKLLEIFEKSLSADVADRDRLLRELDVSQGH